MVSVYGHPIHVQGAVTVPVTIADRNFQQKFIIADSIIAEGILGVDFIYSQKAKRFALRQCEPLSLLSSVPTINENTMNHVTLSKTITIQDRDSGTLTGRR